MNKSFQLLKKNAGFSLIEMMVVVAIAGIMATIAVPNMNIMADRARQGEAKAELAAIYAVEKAFYGEFGYYTYCLAQSGYMPENPTRYYFTGFYNGRGCSGLGRQCTYDAVPTSCNISTAITWSGARRNDASFEMNRWANPSLTGQGVSGNYDVYTESAFLAVAFGSMSGGSPIMDVWTIDDGKNLLNQQRGTK